MTMGNNERELLDACGSIPEPREEVRVGAWERLDSLTKPPRSLGKLEEMAARLAVAQQTHHPVAAPAAMLVLAGDHGVVAEGVSAWPSDVTMQMVANFSAGGAAINQLARHAGARLVVVDVGVAGDTSSLPGVVQAKVRAGTRNMAVEPAMTREEAAAAVLAGVCVARQLADDGIRVIGIGEMGIGNSTAASALTAAFTGVPVSRVVGRGTGIDDVTLARKASVIARALEVTDPALSDPLGTLAGLGGLEIAGMAGVIIGGASRGVCVVTDGFISASAALAAVALCPECLPYMVASHLSQEPGHEAASAALGLEPFLHLDMRLGEGTGAAIALTLLAGACEVMNGMATFAEAGVSERDDG